MRVMPLMQQDLNNRTFAANNQPNFKGVFKKVRLKKFEAQNPVVRRVLDVFGEIVEASTNSDITVTVRKIPRKGIPQGKHPQEEFWDESLKSWVNRYKNLHFTISDTSLNGNRTFSRYIGCGRKVNEMVGILFNNLMESGKINWIDWAKALKKAKKAHVKSS